MNTTYITQHDIAAEQHSVDLRSSEASGLFHILVEATQDFSFAGGVSRPQSHLIPLPFASQLLETRAFKVLACLAILLIVVISNVIQLNVLWGAILYAIFTIPLALFFVSRLDRTFMWSLLTGSFIYAYQLVSLIGYA